MSLEGHQPELNFEAGLDLDRTRGERDPALGASGGSGGGPRSRSPGKAAAGENMVADVGAVPERLPAAPCLLLVRELHGPAEAAAGPARVELAVPAAALGERGISRLQLSLLVALSGATIPAVGQVGSFARLARQDRPAERLLVAFQNLGSGLTAILLLPDHLSEEAAGRARMFVTAVMLMTAGNPGRWFGEGEAAARFTLARRKAELETGITNAFAQMFEGGARAVAFPSLGYHTTNGAAHWGPLRAAFRALKTLHEMLVKSAVQGNISVVPQSSAILHRGAVIHSDADIGSDTVMMQLTAWAMNLFKRTRDHPPLSVVRKIFVSEALPYIDTDEATKLDEYEWVEKVVLVVGLGEDLVCTMCSFDSYWGFVEKDIEMIHGYMQRLLELIAATGDLDRYVREGQTRLLYGDDEGEQDLGVEFSGSEPEGAEGPVTFRALAEWYKQFFSKARGWGLEEEELRPEAGVTLEALARAGESSDKGPKLLEAGEAGGFLDLSPLDGLKGLQQISVSLGPADRPLEGRTISIKNHDPRVMPRG